MSLIALPVSLSPSTYASLQTFLLLIARANVFPCRVPNAQTTSDNDPRPLFASHNLALLRVRVSFVRYQHRLSDQASTGVALVEVFRSGRLAHAVICPECGTSTKFVRNNLKLYRARGEE